MQHKTDSVVDIKRLSEDVEYYNNVFKKIEKIVSVVFYVLSFTDKDDRKTGLSQTLQTQSFRLHDLSLETLQSAPDSVTDRLLQVRHQLTVLDSTIRVAQAARFIAPELALLVVEQIDVVQRQLTNHYLQNTGLTIKDLHAVTVSNSTPTQTNAKPQTSPRKRQQRVQVPAGDISSDAYLVYSQLTDRAERIKTVLEAKPQATIKDVAEIITDVSEKTIQRELNSLIEKGQVLREGERRWSRYSVVKQ